MIYILVIVVGVGMLIPKIFPNLYVKIYDMMCSTFLTRYTYKELAQRLHSQNIQYKNIVDIGVGTGDPLLHILKDLKKDTQILGLDYDQVYVNHAKKLFQNYPNVDIQYQDFLEFESTKRFDVEVFSASIMIMPDKLKAIQIAKKHLNKNGKIYFILTLYEEKSISSRIIGFIKPYLKYIISIDYGQITYRQDFFKLLKQSNLKVTTTNRCKGNLLLKYVFNVYMIETEIEL